MREFAVTIKGVAPLRMNRFTTEAKDSLSGGKSNKFSDDEKIQDAYNRTYKDDEGKYIILAKHLKACILEGASKVALGRGRAKTTAKAVLYIKDTENLLTHSEPKIIEEVVRIPPKKGALAVKYFVVFKDWSTSFVVSITDNRFPEIAVKNSIIEAGIYAGLLDGRPDYGRFVVTKFEKIKE